MSDDKPVEFREVFTIRASKLRPKVVHWLWMNNRTGDKHQAIGKLGILAGEPGVGKSQFTAWLAARVTTGKLQGELYGTPRNVFIAATEDDWEETIVPRLIAAGADMERIHFVGVNQSHTIQGLMLAKDLPELRAELIAHEAALLIFDPLLSRMTRDTRKDQEVRLELEPLVAMAGEVKVAVIGIMHHPKSQRSKNPNHLVQEATAFVAVARHIHTVIPHPEDEDSFLFATTKTNFAKPSRTYQFHIEPVNIEADDDGETVMTEVTRVVWDGEADQSLASAVEMRNESSDDQTAVDQAVDWLVEFLTMAGGEALAKDALAAARVHGINPTTLHRARRKANIKSEREKTARPRAVWTLPKRREE